MPVVHQTIGERIGEVREIKSALLHRVSLSDLVHQRRGIVARHLHAPRDVTHRLDQAVPLLDDRTVGRRGVNVRDEHQLLASDERGYLPHVALDLVVRLFPSHDAREQRLIRRRKPPEVRLLFEPCAPLGHLLDRCH
ncbi:hypothetical protein [Caballeronia sp. GAWG1-5s-s]|uniref:hypothetical protein n=1 Tax=Caballeronia sp. GAWG1-5s-s TaxID=2921743 RepID=UPI002027B450|nr:hypothetical protein [Caballeronia sp. GAWG1-5s-s]